MARKADDVDEAVGGLFDLPLDEFTAARNALASRRKKQGDKAGAARIQALEKPTLSAWATNQLFRRHPAEMEALLESGRVARAAQHAALAGKGIDGLRKSIQSQRSLLVELRARALDLLSDAGRSPGEEILERIATNLQALATDPRPSADALAGRLTRDVDPPGLDVLEAGAATSPPKLRIVSRDDDEADEPPGEPQPTRAAVRVTAAPRRRESEESARRESKAREAKEREAKQREAARREAREAAAREREQQRRKERLADAREAAAAARKEASAADRAARLAETAAAEAARKAEAARRAADEAARRLESAESDLEAARRE